MIWTPKAIAKLRKMAKEGRTFSEAAQVLGTTRCAVAGKCKREGIRFPGSREKLSRAQTLSHVRMKEYWASLSQEERQARIAGSVHKAAQALLVKRGLSK